MAAVVNSEMQIECILLPELIPLILSRLEKTDLLNCRLVCKAWDSECLNILTASDWKLKLDHDNIKKYVEFLKSSPSPQIVLPLQLLVKFYTNRIGNMVEGVNYLLGIFGENCIESLVLSHQCDLGGEDRDDYYICIGKKFLDLLALVSKGLKELNLKNLCGQLNVESVLAITTHRSISFPNLKSFTSPLEVPEEEVRIPVLFNHLMESCPNLSNLRMIIPPDFEEDIHHWNIPLAKLETLAIHNFKPALPFLQKLQLLNPPLKTFELLDSGEESVETDAEGMLLVCILTCISSTLETLNLQNIGSNVCLVFPVLKKLKHLEFYKGPDLGPAFNSIKEINFNSVNFPKLETLEIGINLEDELEASTFPTTALANFPKLKQLTIYSNAHCVNWEWSSKPFFEKIEIPVWFLYSIQTTVFQTVTEVRLNSSSSVAKGLDEPDEFSEIFLQDNIDRFNVLFPVISKISLWYPTPSDDTKAYKTQYYFVRLIKLFLQSKLINEANLKEICLLNSTRNFLRRALKEILYPPRIILENLEEHPGLVDPLAKAWEKYTNGFEKYTTENIVGRSPESEGKAESSSYKRATTVLQNPYVRDLTLNVFSGIERISMLPGLGTCTKEESNLDFTLIARHFPNLRELTVPADWFSTQETLFLEQVQNIREQFNNSLVFEILHPTSSVLITFLSQ